MNDALIYMVSDLIDDAYPDIDIELKVFLVVEIMGRLIDKDCIVLTCLVFVP